MAYLHGVKSVRSGGRTKVGWEHSGEVGRFRLGGSAQVRWEQRINFVNKFSQPMWRGSWRMFGSDSASYILIPKSSGNSLGLKPSTHFILVSFGLL